MAQSSALDELNEVSAPAQTSTAVSLSRGRLVLVLLGLMLGMLLATLDQTVVGTAMPRIVSALGGANITLFVSVSETR